MRKKIVASFCAGLMAVSLAPQGALAHDIHEVNDKIKALEAQLEQLKALVGKEINQRTADSAALESKVSEVGEVAKAAEAKAKESKNNLKLGKDTTLSYGGYIRVNGTFDDYQDGTPPTASVASRILVPSLIPVGNTTPTVSTEFNSDVATSRFFFKTATNTSAGVVRSHVELDFLAGGGDERISNSNNSRIRHAFLAWDYAPDQSLLVGQTCSTFFNVGALPDEVDFIGPTSGSLFNRQQQIRWTKKLKGGGSFMLAAENPSTSLDDGGSGIVGNNFDDNSIPDLVARYNGKAGSHAYAISVIGREIAVDDGIVSEDSFGVGVNWAGKFNINKANEIKYSLSTGTLGRYIALNAFRDGAIDETGDLDLANVTGGYVSWKAQVAPKWSSVLTYALSTADLADGVSSATTEEVSNFNASLFYSPTPKFRFGAGVISAERELENGVSGDLTRIQFMSRYVF